MSTCWPTRTLGNLCGKPQYGFTASASSEPIGPRLLRITDLQDGTLDWNSVPFCECPNEEKGKYSLNSGDIVVARIGATTGRTSLILDPPDAVFASYLIRLRAGDELNPFFLFYFTQSQSYKTWIDGNKDNNLKGGVSASILTQIKVPLPLKDEQDKIAAILWRVQRTIETEEKLIVTARELKQSAMRQLFTCGLHGETQKDTDIGPIPESWDAVPLETLARIGNGSTPLKRNLEYWVNGSIPWLTSAKVYDVTVTKADQFVTPKAVKECHLPRVKPGSVLMAITGQGKTLGNAAVTDIETCVSQHIAYMQFYDESANPHFIRLFLETRYEELRAIAQGGGSTKGALTCGFLKSYCVPLPRGSEKDRSEQDEVVRILMAIEEKIRIHLRKAETLQELFRTLLHQLMTGEIRVADLDIDVSEVTQ